MSFSRMTVHLSSSLMKAKGGVDNSARSGNSPRQQNTISAGSRDGESVAKRVWRLVSVMINRITSNSECETFDNLYPPSSS